MRSSNARRTRASPGLWCGFRGSLPSSRASARSCRHGDVRLRLGRRHRRRSPHRLRSDDRDASYRSRRCATVRGARRNGRGGRGEDETGSRRLPDRDGVPAPGFDGSPPAKLRASSRGRPGIPGGGRSPLRSVPSGHPLLAFVELAPLTDYTERHTGECVRGRRRRGLLLAGALGVPRRRREGGSRRIKSRFVGWSDRMPPPVRRAEY
jgi:hypothetical protein